MCTLFIINIISIGIKIKIATFFFLLVLSNKSFSQEDPLISLSSFIYNHSQFQETGQGLIIPELDIALYRSINFFLQEKFNNIEYIPNVIWESYKTSLTPYTRSHYYTYTVRVKVKNQRQLLNLEVDYFPSNGSQQQFSTNYIWDGQAQTFRLDDASLERFKVRSDLILLKIENQEEKATIDEIINEIEIFQSGNNNNQIIYFDQRKQIQINQIISSFILKSFPNVDFIMNIIWDSYFTSISSYDKFHYHKFIAQVRLKNSNAYKYVDIFYNLKTKNPATDQKWNASREIFAVENNQ